MVSGYPRRTIPKALSGLEEKPPSRSNIKTIRSSKRLPSMLCGRLHSAAMGCWTEPATVLLFWLAISRSTASNRHLNKDISKLLEAKEQPNTPALAYRTVPPALTVSGTDVRFALHVILRETVQAGGTVLYASAGVLGCTFASSN